MRWLAAPRADDVPADEIARRELAVVIDDTEIPAALDALSLTAGQREEIEAMIAARSLRMVSLAVFDSDAEDGDIVRIESLGLAHTVRLTKRPITVPVFLPIDGRISVTGIDQGLGGGVTLGVMTDGLPLKFAPLSPGQTIFIAAL
jgi:hypothetical protein